MVWDVHSGKQFNYLSLIPQEAKEKAEEFQPMGTDPKTPDMQVAAQNDILKLCINPKTAEIAVVDQRTGRVWYSNPQGRGTTGTAADILSSQLNLTYFSSDRKELSYNSYTDSVQKQQFQLQSISNGVRVSYTIGTLSTQADSIPKYLTKERLNEILGKVKTEDNRDTIEDSYIEDTKNAGRMEFLESAKSSEIIMNRILEGFQEAGYTKEDLKKDNSAAGIQAQSATNYFVIPLEYRLDGDQLSVTIPTDQIVEKGSDKILTIEPLEFFGAGSQKDTGYMVVPNGCGGLIRFNNGKGGEQPFMRPVYGEDPATGSGVDSGESDPIRMPVFGIKNGDGAVLAYIEKGEASASIIAAVNGTACPYNYAYPRFTLRSLDKVQISQASGTTGEMAITEDKFYSGSLTTRYGFLKDADADYSGMARYYRDILTENGTLKPLSAEGDVPFYLDILGAVKKEKYLIGVPYDGIVPMTTYRQAEDIVSALQKQGVGSIRMRYLGWFNKGINNDVPSRVKLVKQLGGRSDLLHLNDFLTKSGGQLYLDAAFQQISSDSPNYRESKNSARHLNQFSVQAAEDNRATLSMRNNYTGGSYDLVSPNSLPDIVDRFLPEFGKVGISDLSLRDMGSILTSDKRKSYPINRPVAQSIVAAQLKKLQKDSRLMIAGGNQYALACAADLVDVPAFGNPYYLVDETIPFYEMVIHGSVDYAGEAVNLSDQQDIGAQTLHMLAYGLLPHYCLSYQNGSELQDTAFQNYYSTGYQNWLNGAAESYRKICDVYRNLRTAKIDRYVQCQAGVSETVYDNGVSVYVNYNSEPVTVGSVTIDAGGYALGGSLK